MGDGVQFIDYRDNVWMERMDDCRVGMSFIFNNLLQRHIYKKEWDQPSDGPGTTFSFRLILLRNKVATPRHFNSSYLPLHRKYRMRHRFTRRGKFHPGSGRLFRCKPKNAIRSRSIIFPSIRKNKLSSTVL